MCRQNSVRSRALDCREDNTDVINFLARSHEDVAMLGHDDVCENIKIRLSASCIECLQEETLGPGQGKQWLATIG